MHYLTTIYADNERNADTRDLPIIAAHLQVTFT